VSDEKVNILVVDDLEEKLLVYETILEGLNQNVVVARSGREALRHLLDKDFAVILLDVHMPDMDGLETAAMIRSRRHTAHTPIIFITAFSDEMHTAQGYSLGAVDYILTPVVPEILRTKVGVFVDLYKKTQQVKRQAEEHVALARAQAARAAAEEATRRSAFLAEASTVLVRSLDYEAIPRGLARQAVPFLGDLCAVTLSVENASDRWRTELAWIEAGDVSDAGASPRVQMDSVTDERDLGAISGLILRVIESGEAELFPNIERPSTDGARPGKGIRGEPSAIVGPEHVHPVFGFEPRTALAVPLCARGRTLGAIMLALRDARRAYGPEDLTLAADLAGRAAIALDNARLYRDVQENNRRKNEFLAMLAHELRNPLAPIRNAVEILRMLNIPDADLQWANDVISRQVEQLVRLVDDLLDISRITGGKIQLRTEPVDVSVAVARAVEISRPLIDARRHELTVTLPPQAVRVDADLVRLAQVLANLLNNAAKYTEEGGRIALEVTQVGDEVVFRVRDNGIGISPEMVGSVFDLFTQVDRAVDRAQGGLGVGLTLVRQLVEMHGGSVQAHSEGANCGSEFVVRLPTLAESPVPADDGDSRCDRTPCPTPRRVLIVDDYPAIAESLMRMLHMGGHDVRIAPDGPRALDELTVWRPEIILLDIGLPGMDGYAVAHSIRNRPDGESIVLIALTGYGQEEDHRRSRESGFDLHLTKPVDPAVLFALIGTVRGQVHDALPTGLTLARA
jgi:signal transduction histidine kinase/DNA-binding response OmpR family regulator